jgi:micrococcal nuclease
MSSFRRLLRLTNLAAVTSALCIGCAAPPAPGTGVVRRVVDGDTIEMRIGRANETVRLLGIDTPETVHPTKPIECFGPEAAARTKELLGKGTTVRIEKDVEARDHYGRLLLYVFVGDFMVNESLLREGFARPLSITPNVAHATNFERLATEARNQGVGLWSACRQ